MKPAALEAAALRMHLTNKDSDASLISKDCNCDKEKSAAAFVDKTADVSIWNKSYNMV